jgi:hypothetical protein
MDLYPERFFHLRNRAAEPDGTMPVLNRLNCKPVRPQPACNCPQLLLPFGMAGREILLPARIQTVWPNRALDWKNGYRFCGLS